ncbi:MAG TPA: hypothetical protein VJV23_14695 [Candidatus Polarisedimenticolia bacterium]|nr:hypothetical protein [Candidatus Polarisedimenticolia bacterium]
MPAARAALPAAVLALLLAAAPAGCGKKGAPQPPLRVVPEDVGPLTARQVADRVVLSFRQPASRTDESPLAPETAIEVHLSARDPAPRSARELISTSAVAWTLPRERWRDYAQGTRLEVGLRLDRIASALELQGPGSLAGKRLSFAVSVAETARRRSSPSQVATLTVCAPPGPPSLVAASAVEQGVSVAWEPFREGPPPAGYNVYRIEGEGPMSDRPLNPVPVAAAPFLDDRHPRGVPVRYVVRAVLAGSERCESSGSPAPAVTWVDRFPPAPVEGLAAVDEQGSIRLFWRPNREPDLAGYRVYRSEGSGPLMARTGEPVISTSFTDRDVSPGIVYSYAVTALDGATPPNESAIAERAEEMVPEPR